MDDDQQFCLRWNNHQSTLVAVFDTLLEKGMHVDCTLAAEGQTLKAHKVVLSACSPYFESVLSQQYDKHPIIILKDVKYAELRAMMDYMYRGEVNISQDQLAALLKAAESLQIKGLSDNKPSRPPSRPAPPPPPPPSVPTAHPPRTISPPPQVRDGSIDSREGSVSPSRRRKKARRMSTDSEPAVTPAAAPAVPITPAPQGNGRGESPRCKEESSRDNLDDLTYDEDADDPHALANIHHPPTHNDVVRNFQWHMERSQDEMNSSDNVRESQGRKPATPRNSSIMTRSKKGTEEGQTTIQTFAILKPVKAARTPAPASPAPVVAASATPTPPPPPVSDDAKENKTAPGPVVPPRATPPGRAPGAGSGGGGGGAVPRETKGSPRYNIYPRDRHALPCAQYKTEKGYKCPNCNRSYNARKNLVRHVTLECGREPQYKCPYCSYSKHRRNELKNHIEKKHSELRPAGAARPQPDLSDASSP